MKEDFSEVGGCTTGTESAPPRTDNHGGEGGANGDILLLKPTLLNPTAAVDCKSAIIATYTIPRIIVISIYTSYGSLTTQVCAAGC